MTSATRTVIFGGAGYIGSHTCKLLRSRGHTVVAVDNLVSGHRSAVQGDLVVGDIRDLPFLVDLLQGVRPEVVMHFAAFAAAGDSLIHPGKYFANNVDGTRSVLDACVAAGVHSFVFSSSCAVYGPPQELPITEGHATQPTTPYGVSKLMCEEMFPWYLAAHDVRYISLRYFNAAGASLDGSIGDDARPVSRLIPVAFQVALGQRDHLDLYGTDYPTPDGSPIRDYIHVEDLADAHLRAFDFLTAGGACQALNLGTGRGYSTREVVRAIERASGRQIPVVERPRRPGDVAEVSADSSAARRVLGWVPRYSDIATIVETDWRWHRANPFGYPD